MTHLLDRTYGFDREYEKVNITFEPPVDIIQSVADLFQVRLDDISKLRSNGRRSVLSLNIMGRAEYERNLSWLKHHEGRTMSVEAQLQRVTPKVHKHMASAVLLHWTPPLDGYDNEDYLQFAAVVQQQTMTILDAVQQQRNPGDQDVEDIRFLSKIAFPLRFSNWRAHALSFMKQPTLRPLAPKSGQDIEYGEPVQTAQEFRQRVKRAGQIIEPLTEHQLTKLFFDPYATDFMYARKSQRNFGYVRALEMNAFLHEGEDGQTFGAFLEGQSIHDTIWNITMEHYSPLTDVLYRGKTGVAIPLFMQFESSDKLGVRTKDLMLNLTKEQWTELYENPQKKPDLVRTDAKSNTLKYVEGFLEGFFQASTALDSFQVMDRRAADMAVFQTLLGGDMKRYEQVVQSLHENPVGRLRNRRKGREMGADLALDLFLSIITLPRIFDNSEALLVFSILHEYDAFDSFDMLDRMLFVKALETPKLFARDNGTVDSALSLLALAVLEDRIPARLMVKIMVEGIKHPKQVPVIHDEESVALVNRLEDAPPEWVLPLFELRAREQKITAELQAYVDVATTS